jgi:uncharacterized protein YkwD
VTSGRTRGRLVPALLAATVGIVAAAAATVAYGITDSAISDGAPVAMAESHSMMEDEVVDIANRKRAEAGCEPLFVDERLDNAAEAHSRDMARRDYFDHTTPEGVTFRDRIQTAGFANPGTGENIARGLPDAKQVMASWMASEEHRSNILNCEFSYVGIGLDEDGMYWTQDFGKA